MRTLALTALVTLTALAGCIGDPAPSPGDAGAASEVERQRQLNEILADAEEFCESEDDPDCDFWDQHYHEYVVYDLDTTVFDVVIVPPAGATTPDNIAASRQAVQAWRDGIKEYAADWLVDAFEINVYAVGIDVPSLDAVADPEIVVVSSSAEFIVGIGLEPVQFGCRFIGDEVIEDLGGHFHGDHQVFAQNCAGTDFTCFALNVGAMDPRGLYDLIAHEVGHCLGAGHVGDAGDFRARYAPMEDIMSYQDNPEQVHCVSNLNVRTLEGVYAHLMGRPDNESLPYGSFYHMHPLDYTQVDCENPPGM